MVLLRARPAQSGRPVNDISHDIVTRRLRLDSNGEGDGTQPATEERD